MSSARTPSAGASTGTLIDHVQETGAAYEQVVTPPPPRDPPAGQVRARRGPAV